MLKRGIAFGFWFTLLFGFAACLRLDAKPGDLPANNHIECPDCGDDPMPRKFSLELKVTPKGIDVQFGFGEAQPETPPILDPFLPAFVEYWLQHAADVFSHPERSVQFDQLWKVAPYLKSLAAPAVRADETPMVLPPVVEGEKKPALDVEKQLRQLFESADYYRRTGLYESARYLYQRVHLLSPTSRLGRMAIEQLQEIENRLRGSSEEQEPEPERDIRNGTMPLGLVRVIY